MENMAYGVQFGLIASLGGHLMQWGVVACMIFPGTVHIVCHHIDEMKGAEKCISN